MIDSILDFIARVIVNFLSMVYILVVTGLCLGCVVGIISYLCAGEIFKAILCLLGLCLIIAIMIEINI